MRVLVVDDDNARADRIVAALELGSGERPTATVVGNARDARLSLRDQRFDIAIIDVVLPTFSGRTPDQSGGLALIEEIVAAGLYTVPSYIVGITAYAETAKDASKQLEAAVWKVLYADAFDDGWLSALSSLGAHVASVSRSHEKREAVADVLWVTALQAPELEAALRLPFNWARALPLESALYCHSGTLGSTRVLATSCLRMGAVEAALVTGRLLDLARPQVAVMSGICAGIVGRARLGDLIVASEVWNWEAGKVRPFGKFDPDPCSLFASELLVARFQQLQRDADWAVKTWQSFPGSKPAHPPTVLLAPMATGSPVVAASEVAQRIAGASRKTAGIDMEAHGFYAACKKFPALMPHYIAAKSVCDFADEAKNDDVQEYCAHVSASAIAWVLERL